MPTGETNRLPARERYRRDPWFRMLVDAMVQHLDGATFTPTELREAAVLACTLCEERAAQPTTGRGWA